MTTHESTAARPVESQRGSNHPVGDLANLLWRHKGLMMVCLGSSLAAGMVYLKYVPPVYEVNSQLMVEQENLMLDETHTQFQYDQAFLATQAQIMSSPAVVNSVARTASQHGNDLGSNPVETILANITALPIHGTNVVDLSFRHSNGKLALEVVEELIASYKAHLRESQYSSRLELQSLLTRREKDLREELDSLEAQYRELRTRGSTMGLGKEASAAHASQLAVIGTSLNATKNRRISLENRLRLVTEWRDSRLATNESSHPISVKLPTSPEINADEQLPTASAASGRTNRGLNEVDETVTLIPRAEGWPELESIQTTLFQARVREKELEQLYGDKHALLRTVREQIATWESMIRQQVDSMPALLTNELETTRLDEQRQTEAYQLELEKVKQLDQQLIEEEQVFGSINRVQTIHETILTQLRQLELQNDAVADGRSGVKVTVLAAPTLSDKPVWPSPLLVFGTCSAIGLIGGFRLAVGRERSRRQTEQA